MAKIQSNDRFGFNIERLKKNVLFQCKRKEAYFYTSKKLDISCYCELIN